MVLTGVLREHNEERLVRKGRGKWEPVGDNTKVKFKFYKGLKEPLEEKLGAR